MNGQPAGLYLHVPFCTRICPYCDFAVRTGDAARRRRYVDHLLGEVELYAADGWAFDTVYFGGGTPSLLEVADLARVLEAIGRRLSLAPEARVYLEANPEDVTRERLAAWTGSGIGTLSLGVQSLDAEGLRFLGRRHGVAEAERAVGLALAAGFRTVSIDLIYGRPAQTADAWRRELDRAVALGPDHITCYQLTVHDRTRFGLLERRGLLRQLSVDAQAELFALTHRHLNAAGFQGYEVSQFAASTLHRSRHNLKYWAHVPYLGLGPAAHSFRDRTRWWNARRADDWQREVAAGRRPVEGREELDDRALALECLMLGFRTYDGVDLEQLRWLVGVDLLVSHASLVERLVAERLLTVEERRLVPTLEGLAVGDGLAALFEL